MSAAVTRGKTAQGKRTGWRSRIVGHGEEAPDQLLANPRNWRIHPKTQQDALAGVLDEVGWVQDIIVNQLTGYVVDGTTLIACERLGRRCYAMEIEPRYVDVAVRRWEQYTGREATRGGP